MTKDHAIPGVDTKIAEVAGTYHNELAARALRWAAARSTRRGIRGAREVQLGESYVADAACLGSFQKRLYRRYCRRSGLEPLTFTPTRGARGDIGSYWLMVFEVKVSRADFLGTFGPSHKASHANRHAPIANAHWCVVASGFYCADLPNWWGMLTVSGGGLAELRAPKLFKVSDVGLDAAAHAILWSGCGY